MLSQDLRNRAKEIVQTLTAEEKLRLINGADQWHTIDLSAKGLPPVMVSDGPHGLRKQESAGNPLGLGASIKTVCFPTAAGTAASWNRALLRQLGESLGEIAQSEDVSVVLGPAVNIKRSPLCGRNFEYFSEDPYLSGEMAVAYTEGVQSRGVGVSLKHFAANNQETRRMTAESVADERTLREIYYPSFEQTVKRADPWTVMCSYNKLYGEYVSESKKVLTDLLRGEWDYDGMVVSDWGATSDRAKAAAAGQDLSMPGAYLLFEKELKDALANGSLTEEQLNTACENVACLVLRAAEGKAAAPCADNAAYHETARRMATETMPLLKNDGILPLSKDTKAAFLGAFAEAPRFQGGGSSHVNAYKPTSAVAAAAAAGLSVTYSKAFGLHDFHYDSIAAAPALQAAKEAEVAVIFAALPDNMDNEALDRKNIDLPPCQTEFIRKCAEVQPNTVVVLMNGSAVRMPWAPHARAILESYLGGEAVGEAQIDLLYGDANPSAKLAESFPLAMEDVPCHTYFPGSKTGTEYREGLYVGYRYYDSTGKDVQFPFGHGLSYTAFKYSTPRCSPDKVTLRVTNTGERDGAEIVQVYAAPPLGGVIYRPEQVLCGFEKVELAAGESKRVSIQLDVRAFQFYDTAKAAFVPCPGSYELRIGASSRDIRLRGSVTIEGDRIQAPIPKDALPHYFAADVENITDAEFELLLGHPIPASDFAPGRRIGWNETLDDAADGKAGRFIGKVIRKSLGLLAPLVEELGSPEVLLGSAFEMPVRVIAQWAGGFMDRPMADSFISLLNDEHILKSLFGLGTGAMRGLKRMLCKK
ncbi:MAG: glycoside hydrolase family 3 C-terminal domain-containing protein [Oscillospiraceae bacterium]|nr:glycoside hydrolase family 3 C-terminal domain-containing protein [Oscillospiraceae bacterium]